MRRRIELILEAWARLSFQRPWTIVLVVLAISAVPLAHLPQIRIKTSTESLLHPDDEILLAYNAFREEFGRDGQIFLGIETPAVFHLAFLEKLKRFHGDLERELPHIEEITSLVNARSTRGERDELIVEDLLEDFPTNDQEAAEAQRRALNNPLYKNLLFSPDLRHTLVSLKLQNFSQTGDWEGEAAWESPPAQPLLPAEYLSGEDLAEVVSALFDVINRFEDDEFRVHAVGQPVAATMINTIMREDVARFVSLAFATTAALLLILFRRPAPALLSLLSVGLSLTSTVGLMAFLRAPLQIPTQVLPPFLLCVGVCCSVHLLTAFYQRLSEGVEKEVAMAFALHQAGPPLMMTTITTAAAVASFLTSSIYPVSNLGIFAPVGVLLSLVYTLSLLPALIAIVPIRESRGQPPRQVEALRRGLTRIALFSARYPGTVVVVGILLLVFGTVGALQNQLSYYPLKWFKEAERTRIDAERFDEALRGGQTLEILLDTGRVDGVKDPAFLAALDRIHEYNETVERGPLYIGKTSSIVDVLKETHRSLNENRPEFYRIPESRQLVAQELLLFENSGSDDLKEFTDSQFRIARVTVKVPWADAVLYPPFIHQLESFYRETLGDEVEVVTTGIFALDARAFVALTEDLGESYLWAVALIAPLMMTFFWSLRWGAASMLPNLVPIAMTVGMMGWLNVPLDSFTMLTGSIAIGLAVDDTIHTMLGFRRNYERTGDSRKSVEETLETTGEAVLFTTVILALGFALFAFGRMLAVMYFGLLTSFALLMALIADVTLGPALMVLLVGRAEETPKPRPSAGT